MRLTDLYVSPKAQALEPSTNAERYKLGAPRNRIKVATEKEALEVFSHYRDRPFFEPLPSRFSERTQWHFQRVQALKFVGLYFDKASEPLNWNYLRRYLKSLSIQDNHIRYCREIFTNFRKAQIKN
jgi:hypothetical protein